MEHYKIKVFDGDNFFYVAEKAKKIATERKACVHFEFSGIKCFCRQNTFIPAVFKGYRTKLAKLLKP